MNILFPKIGTNLSLDKLNYDIYKNQFNYEVILYFCINQLTLKLRKILLHIWHILPFEIVFFSLCGSE